LNETWALRAKGQAVYDLAVYGPNGFLRAFKGSIEGTDKANLAVATNYNGGGITLEIQNRGANADLRVLDAYTRQTTLRTIAAGKKLVWHWALEDSYGWYDLTITVDGDPSFRWQLAGHDENGKDSVTDPALGA
jgi:phospholipase C